VADRWAHYQPKDLDVMLGEVAAIHTAHPGIHFASGPKYMVRVTVAPVTRELPSDVLAFLTRWQQHWGVDHHMESAVTHVVLVSGRTSFTWMPIQGSLVPALKRAPVGESIDLYVMFLGILATGDSVFLINAFAEGPAQSSESESPPHNKPYLDSTHKLILRSCSSPSRMF